MELYRPVRLVWPLAAAFALLAGPARADVIRRPPDDCPPGSEGGTGHCGAECYALVCTNDDECPDGTTCQAAKACIRVLDCFPEPQHVHGGACSPEDTCRGDGETCQTIDLCLPAGETSSGGSDTGSSTGSTSSGSTSGGSTGSDTSSGSTSTGSTSTGSTSSTNGGTTSGSTSSTTTSTSNGSTEATPTTGGQPGTTGSGTSSSTGGGAGSNTGGGGSGDKAGCAGCGLAEGPHGVLALLVIVGARRRRPRRPVPKVL
ncbi:hypothetical protein [Nannocystis punicea]|uniref:Uncharacterized protein n=1 Tax=Nannocystis punicea TaxID=2995304 RepID=A0ABY7GT10_9BACT|nr:hypothetical protein [Nannocystis poenicansa]WAS90064.1 hypothetical protein O0S08_28045 [Nannocystis poenicansa]